MTAPPPSGNIRRGVKGGAQWGVWAPLSANPEFGSLIAKKRDSVLLLESSRVLGACSAMSGDCSEFLEKNLQTVESFGFEIWVVGFEI